MAVGSDSYYNTAPETGFGPATGLFSRVCCAADALSTWSMQSIN